VPLSIFESKRLADLAEGLVRENARRLDHETACFRRDKVRRVPQAIAAFGVEVPSSPSDFRRLTQGGLWSADERRFLRSQPSCGLT
jgi:hypothetical protein